MTKRAGYLSAILGKFKVCKFLLWIYVCTSIDYHIVLAIGKSRGSRYTYRERCGTFSFHFLFTRGVHMKFTYIHVHAYPEILSYFLIQHVHYIHVPWWYVCTVHTRYSTYMSCMICWMYDVGYSTYMSCMLNVLYAYNLRKYLIMYITCTQDSKTFSI